MLLWGSHTNQFFSNVDFLAIFFTGCTVFISRTAEPSSIWATSTWTFSSRAVLFNNLFGCSHGNHNFCKISFLAIFLTGCAVFITGAAEPSNIWATSTWAFSSRAILFDFFLDLNRSSHGNQNFSKVGFLAVFFTCCAVFISRTTEPSSIGTTSTWAFSSGAILFNNFFGCSHGNEFFCDVGFLAIFFTSSTIFISRTTEPSSIWATSPWAFSSGTILLDNLFGCSHGDQFLSNANSLTVFFTGSTVFISRTAEPSSIWTTSTWTFSSWTILFDFLFLYWGTISLRGSTEVSIVTVNIRGFWAASTWTFRPITPRFHGAF